MKSYSSYQESGVDWIGQVPSSWTVKKGKFLFRNRKEINSENQCSNLLSLTLFGVLNKDMDSSEGLRPTDYKTYQVFYKDDLVFKLIDLENKKTSRVGLVHERGIMSPVYIRLIPNKQSLPKYYFYQYFDLYKKYIFNFLGSGVRSSLTPSDLLDIQLVHPPLPEQIQIVSFLDYKTQKIDELIEKTKKKIELLKEEQNSLINHCVTKGLNPNAEMKDSGVKWIGKIPSHWKISKGKYILKVLTGSYPNELIEDDYGVAFIKVEDLNHTVDKYYLDESKSSVKRSDAVTPLEKNILLFPKRGMTIFTNKIVISRVESYIDPNLMAVKVLQNTNIKFILYVIKSRGLGDICDSSTIPQINNKHIYPLEFVYPPLSEQHQIVEYLDEQTQNIDSTIEKETQRIELLKEYRQSLISEVVTGKIDVRDWKE